MEKTTWKHMDAAERAELEAALGSPDKFLSDEQDAMAWWVLLLVAAVCGLGACIYEMATDSYGGGFASLFPFAHGVPHPFFFLSHPHVPGFYLALGIAAWVIYTFCTSHKRRGVAVTSYGLARVRGHKVQLFRYRDIATATDNTVGARGKRFTVLTLSGKDGKKYDLYCHGNWAKVALTKLKESATPAR